MAKKQQQQTTPSLPEPQDFSSRYPGAHQVDPVRGGWHQFEKVGDDLVGEYKGMEPFKNGFKGTIRRQNGELVVFSIPTLLRDQLREVKAGERIAIVLSGFQASSNDSPMKVFQVFKQR